MSQSKLISELELLAPGGIIDLVQDEDHSFELIKITGNDTLTGALSIVSTGNYSDNSYLQVFYAAVMDFDGKNVDVMGHDIPEYLGDKKWVMHCFYNKALANWETYLVLDLTIPGVDPELDEVAASLASIDSAGKFLIGQGSASLAKSIAGHVVIAKTGLATIQDDVITPQMLTFGLDNEIAGFEKVLTIGQINNLFTNPIEILGDNGVPAGYFVSVMSIAFSYVFAGGALVLADDLELQYNDGSAIKDLSQADFTGGANKIWTVYNNLDTDAVADKGIRIQAKVANITGGAVGTSLRVKIFYTLTKV